jgi:hypothetical protein
MENHTAFAATTECNDLINEGFAEVWDILVDASPPDYYSSETTVTTASGTTAYALPADFYKLRAVFVDEGNGEYRPISESNEQERQYYRAPSGIYSVVVRYIAGAPQLGSGDDAVTFDGVNGWEELCVLSAAIKLLDKEGTNASALMMAKARIEQRIQKMAGRNHGEPPRVIRRSLRYRDTFRAWANTVDTYHLRGSNIELFRCSGSYLL